LTRSMTVLRRNIQNEHFPSVETKIGSLELSAPPPLNLLCHRYDVALLAAGGALEALAAVMEGRVSLNIITLPFALDSHLLTLLHRE
jgi:hypothetical protein